MKKLIFISLSVLIISFLGSCGKKDFTDIQGRIIEKGSNKGIVNAKVVFSQCISNGILGGSSCEAVDTVLTDANGNYRYTVEDDQTINYHIEAFKDNYYMELLQTASGGQISKNVNIVMLAHAWIKFHVKNVNPFDDSDYIAAPGALNYADKYYFFGKDVGMSYVLGNKYVGNLYFEGNSTAKFYWDVRKNGVIKKYQDSLFIKGLDTLNYQINY
jgi:hypothetical protein